MLTEQEAADTIILALDCTRQRALEITKELEGRLAWAKVGMTLYYQEGPSVVTALKELGLKVFLDLKLFDIPFQVEGAARAAAQSGADLVSLHGLGGAEMISAAARGVASLEAPDPTKLIAITVLTSMNRQTLASIGVEGEVAAEVERLATLALENGANGLVCSPEEVARLRGMLGPEALLICPGVRPAGAKKGDQKRTATPAEALARGASKLVIGRPIMAADDPRGAFDAIVEEICEGA